MPGQRGSVMLSGHNYYEGYAVFKFLITLKKGDRLRYVRANGKGIRCKVTRDAVNVRRPTKKQVLDWNDPTFKGRRVVLVSCGRPQGNGVYLSKAVVPTSCSAAK